MVRFKLVNRLVKQFFDSVNEDDPKTITSLWDLLWS